MNVLYAKFFKWVALGLTIYMPLHVFLSTWLSTYTGGLDAWKAAKDILIVVLVPLLLWAAYRYGLFKDRVFRNVIILGALYTAIHMAYVLFDGSDDTESAIIASVYNTRLLGFFLLGYVVSYLTKTRNVLKWMITTGIIVSTIVATFGVLQYVLPPDLLESFGYSTDRGVKALFFIDDKPEFPRVMSTLKDPNSFGAFLILPTLLTTLFLYKKNTMKAYVVRTFRREFLLYALVVHVLALWLTFSRGALLSLMLAGSVMVLYALPRVRTRQLMYKFVIPAIVVLTVLGGAMGYALRDNDIFQNIVLHADESTIEADPNEKRLQLYEEAIDGIVEEPIIGYGPGTAGLIAIRNPQASLLTENYYLQIAYEVGLVGLTMFISIITILSRRLHDLVKREPLAIVLIATLAAHLFYSLLIHLWSNEALAVQWWLLVGALLGVAGSVKGTNDKGRLIIDAEPFARDRISGIGKVAENTTLGLLDNTDLIDKYEITLLVSRSKKKFLKAKVGNTVRIKTYPMGARVTNALNYYRLLPKIDRYFGRGTYIFYDFYNYPVSKKSRTITWVHDIAYLRHPDTVSEKLRVKLQSRAGDWMKRSNVVVAVSEFTKKELLSEYDLFDSKVKVVNPGVNVAPRTGDSSDIQKLLDSYSIPRNYILFIGNIEPRKNIGVLVDAYTSMSKELKSKYALVIIGGAGWNSDSLLSTIKDHRNNGECIVTPDRYVPDEDVHVILRKAALYVSPSMYEGFGITPIEAIKSGVPTVVSDIGVNADIYTDTIKTFKPDSPVDLQKLMIKELTHKTKIDRSLLKSTFTWSQSVNSVAEIIEELSTTSEA